MADRKLVIEIVVEDQDAKGKLASADKAVDKIKDTAKGSGAALSDYDKTVQQVVTSKQALTTVTDKYSSTAASTTKQVQALTDRQEFARGVLERYTGVS